MCGWELDGVDSYNRRVLKMEQANSEHQSGGQSSAAVQDEGRKSTGMHLAIATNHTQLKPTMVSLLQRMRKLQTVCFQILHCLEIY
jgi:hypothetical protein